MIRTAAEVTGGFDEGVDVVIVGSGAGGGTVARGLAEAGRSVLVLEEGAHHPTRDFTARPAEGLRRLYRDAGLTLAFGRPSVLLPLGRCVGGSTTINSGTCLRSPDWALADWREYGLGDIAAGALDPYYGRVERDLDVGPVSAETLSENAAIVARGAEALGWAHGPLPRNASGCRGSGVCAFGCPRDAKRATLVAALPRAMAAGARIQADARVERVVTGLGRARGVRGHVLDPETGRPIAPFRVRARAVIVAAGTVHSPWILLRSGVGNGSGQVGRNLHIHPAAKASGLFDEAIHAWAGVPQGYGVHEFHREGILMEEASTPPEATAVGLHGHGPAHRALMEASDRLATFGALVADVSRGRVLRGPFGRPLVTYLFRVEDARRLAHALRLIGRLFFAAGARRVFLPLRDFESVGTEAELERLDPARARPTDFDLVAFHPMGTCRMGADPRRSVVRPDLRSHDLPGLYVVDGSVLPASPHVNPQLTIMALATRAAEDIDRHLSVGPRRVPREG